MTRIVIRAALPASIGLRAINWKWTKSPPKIRNIICGGEVAMIEWVEFKEGASPRTDLLSDLIGCSVWVGDEQILIKGD
jgi:hypothetical protein